MSRRGFPSTLGAMGEPDLAVDAARPRPHLSAEAPYGCMDPAERSHVLDAERIDAVVLYTTVGLLWEAELEDPALSQAYTRAYNRWICEFCAGNPRLVPTAHLSLSDPVAAAPELERAVGEGARGAYVAPFTQDGHPLGHPDHNPVFAAAQDLDVPFAIHPTFEPQWTKGARMGSWEHVKQLRLLTSVSASDGVRHQFTTLFDYGVFDKFPGLQVLVLESGGGWIGYWLDRIDAVYGHTFIGERVPLEHQPSDYFRDRVLDQVRSGRAQHPRAGRALRSTGSCGRRTSPTPTTPPSTSTTSTNSWPCSPPTSSAVPRRQRPHAVRHRVARPRGGRDRCYRSHFGSPIADELLHQAEVRADAVLGVDAPEQRKPVAPVGERGDDVGTGAGTGVGVLAEDGHLQRLRAVVVGVDHGAAVA